MQKGSQGVKSRGLMGSLWLMGIMEACGIIPWGSQPENPHNQALGIMDGKESMGLSGREWVRRGTPPQSQIIGIGARAELMGIRAVTEEPVGFHSKDREWKKGHKGQAG